MADNLGGRTAVTRLGPIAAGWESLRPWVELLKPRISGLLILATAASYGLAARSVSHPWWQLVVLLFGVALLCASVFPLNQLLERESDARMNRTKRRPLPEGRLTITQALVFGVAASIGSVAWFGLLFNWLTAAVAVLTIVSYLVFYTPLKRITAHHTIPGAISGATPPLIAYAAATGRLGVEAWILFALMFVWQVPHFLSIGMIYRNDYVRAGIRVLPAEDTSIIGTRGQIIGSLSILVAIASLPGLIGMSAPIYLLPEIPVSIAFLVVGILVTRREAPLRPHLLLRASVFYLPIVLILLLVSVR